MMNKRLVLLAAPFVFMTMVAACATTAGDAERRDRSDPNVLTRAELEDVNVSNAYDAVERLRPRWLVPRTRSVQFQADVVVFFNNSPVGDVTSLRQMNLDGIHEIRYLDPAEAQTRLAAAGYNLSGGVIQVRTAAGSR
jgi:hypothetical protein